MCLEFGLDFGGASEVDRGRDRDGSPHRSYGGGHGDGYGCTNQLEELQGRSSWGHRQHDRVVVADSSRSGDRTVITRKFGSSDISTQLQGCWRGHRQTTAAAAIHYSRSGLDRAAVRGDQEDRIISSADGVQRACLVGKIAAQCQLKTMAI